MCGGSQLGGILQEDLAFKKKKMEEAKKLKEMQQKASGKGPLRKLIAMEC